MQGHQLAASRMVTMKNQDVISHAINLREQYLIGPRLQEGRNIEKVIWGLR